MYFSLLSLKMPTRSYFSTYYFVTWSLKSNHRTSSLWFFNRHLHFIFDQIITSDRFFFPTNEQFWDVYWTTIHHRPLFQVWGRPTFAITCGLTHNLDWPELLARFTMAWYFSLLFPACLSLVIKYQSPHDK